MWLLRFLYNSATGYKGGNKYHYYTAMSQEDWKQTNSRIWLAKIDLDRGLDFPI